MVALFAAFRAKRGFAAVIVAIVVFGFGYSFATNLAYGNWEVVHTLDTRLASSNAVDEIEFAVAHPAMFFTAADRSDEDGDALTDAEERLVYRTDPSLPDTDGDGLDDGGEIAAGILTKCDFRIAC